MDFQSLIRWSGCVFIVIAAAVSAQDYSQIRSFGFPEAVGQNPKGELIEGSDGLLYGTARYSSRGDGGVFSINKNGSDYRPVYFFQNPSTEGTVPDTGVVEGPGGFLYGTTRYGGQNYEGVVFKVKMDGTQFAIVHTFDRTNGSLPNGSLLLRNDGFLYGAARSGGVSSNGVLFKVSTNGTGFTILKAFSGIGGDGANPVGKLVDGGNGVLYGVTTAGGSFGQGTVFKIDNTGAGYSILRQLGTGFRDGHSPQAGLLKASDGLLYGVTSHGADTATYGTVFKMSTNGSGFTVLKEFFPSDPKIPLTALVEGADGALYGTMEYASGSISPGGCVFKMGKTGSGFLLLKEFSSTDGHSPSGLLLASDGLLYGTTEYGGAFDAGTVYKMDQSGNGFIVGKNFTPLSDGRAPLTRLLSTPEGILYGAHSQGGQFGQGTVFRFNPTDGSYSNIWHVNGNSGPRGNLADGADGFLYGTALYGGTNFAGSIFKVMKTNGVATILKHFSSADGEASNPESGLILGQDGVLYGTTYSGGLSNAGTIFKINRDGTGYSVLRSFLNDPDGSSPSGPLLQGSDGFLYGTTVFGGTSDFGTVFKINTNGTSYSVLYSFNIFTSGGFLVAPLIEGSDGFLYGTASSGGANFRGTIFRINKTGSAFTLLKTMSSADGDQPEGGVVEGPDGILYGTTRQGGSGNAGTVFKLNKDGSGFELLKSFSSTNGDGYDPRIGLTLAHDGAFYGTTISGGSNQLGTLFQITLSSPPAPLLLPPLLVDGLLHLRWTAVSGRTYRVQWTDDLNSASWTNSSPIVATETTATYSVAWEAQEKRFYRTVLQP